MEHTLEEILMDFKIVSMLQPSQKLYVNDNRLALDTSKASHMIPKIWRYLGNHTRRNVLHKIRQRVTELENYMKNDLIPEPWISEEFKQIKEKLIQGLKHMQTTYETDSQTVVYIDVIIKRVENLL